MPKNDTMRDIMKPSKRPRPKKNRTVDNHYRSNADEYELVARIAHDRNLTIAEYTRNRLIPPNAQEQLRKLREKQRKAGDPDEWFTHPKLIKKKAA